MNYQKVLIPFLSAIRKQGWFIVVLLLLALFRLNLAVSGGQMYWPDEKIYRFSARFLTEVRSGSYREAIPCLFRAYPGRPGFIWLSSIPEAIRQVVFPPGKTGPADPLSFRIPAVFNVVVSLLISLFFYLILSALTRRPNQALLGMVVYSLLCNTNLYLRHLLPYDYSLLLFLIALSLVLPGGRAFGITRRRAVISGIISSLGFLTYPGYFLFAAIILVLIFFFSNPRPRGCFFYLLPAAAVLILAELTARFSGAGYLFNFFYFGVKIQGSFEEGYIFAGRYLTEVEGLIGVVLLVLILTYLILCVIRPPRSSRGKVLIVSAFLAYLFYGTLSTVFHLLVFQGRIFHMYLPFIVWGSILALNTISRKKIRRLLSFGLLALSLVSFSGFALRYSRLRYPRDFKAGFVGDGSTGYVREDKPSGKGDLAGCLSVGVNLNHFSKISGSFIPFLPPPDLRLVESVPHPLNFPAYPFEGYSVSERKVLKERNYQMSVYVRPRRKEVNLRLLTPAAKDYLLLIDIGISPAGIEPGVIPVLLNGYPLAGNIKEGLNYIFLPRRMVTSPESHFRICADPGIPPDILVDLAPLEKEYLIDLGRRSRVDDHRFLGRGFFDPSRSGNYRAMNKEGEIKIPVFSSADRRPLLKLKVRNNLGQLSPLLVKLDLGGALFSSFTVPAEYQWTVLKTELPSTPGELGTSWLGIYASPISEASEIDTVRKRKGLLSIDRLAIEWLAPPEDK